MTHAKLHPLPLTAARWTTGFWADRFNVCKNSMVPAMGRLMQDTQRIRFLGNFEVAAGLVEGKHRGAKWNDGDFYKWLEAAATIYAFTHDKKLDEEMDQIIALIAKVQDPDGYIHTDVQIRQHAGEDVKRFGNPMDFEMYNAGHLITAACVHFKATNKTSLLVIAINAANFLDNYFENPTPEIARHGICPAHLMALIQLHQVTNEKKYLKLADRLLQMRELVTNGDDDNQDRIPLREQRQAIGHAVRATYLYAGAADLYTQTGDETLLEPLQSIWTDLVSRKLYITGGCGALYDGASPDASPEQQTISRVHQSFGRNYQLPQSTAHNETCAAIGNMLWNWRMLLITGESRFADVIEQSLYNSVLAGISLDGESFFYTNTLRQLNPMPVELRWNRHREKFTGCFCCPPNVVRTIAQSPTYAYAHSENNLWTILYGSNQLTTGPLKLKQETNYPWDGMIRFIIESAPTEKFTLNLRIPNWCPNATLKINGANSAAPKPGTFYPMNQKWKIGDTVELNLPMPVRLVEANPFVEEARNQVAVVRGPIVYCLESVDLPKDTRLMDVYLTTKTNFTTTTDPALPGITVLQGQATAMPPTDWSTQLYRNLTPQQPHTIDIRLIPYFAWDNRAPADMTVWLPVIRS